MNCNNGLVTTTSTSGTVSGVYTGSLCSNATVTASASIDPSSIIIDTSLLSTSTSYTVKKTENQSKMLPEIDIVDVKVIYDKNDTARAIKVKFEDGDIQKAVCSEDDSWDLSIGISICIAKHLLYKRGYSNPSSKYNKLIRKGAKIFHDNWEKEEIAKKEKEAIEYRKAKRAEKKKRREERKKEEAKKEAIDIQREALLQAMRLFKAEHDSRNSDDLK